MSDPKTAHSGSDALGTRAFFELTGRFTAREWEDQKSRSFIDPETQRVRSDRAFHHGRCPLCGGEEVRELFVKQHWVHWLCDGCDGIYVDPCLSQAALDTEVYGETAYPFAGVVNSEIQVRFDRPRFVAALDVLEETAPTRSILDVGCGAGLFLSLARERGWEVLGTEPLTAYRRLAVDRLGARAVRADPVSRLDCGDRRFGVIAFWEVLDHVTDPSAVLARCVPWLAPGGVVLIYVRNAQSLAARVLRERCNVFLGYAHLTFWSTESIHRVAARHRLEVLQLRSLISELGPVNNYLSYQDPYQGSASAVIPGITPELVEGAGLGYKLLAYLRAP